MNFDSKTSIALFLSLFIGITSFTLFGKKENKALPKMYREVFGWVPEGEVELDGKVLGTSSFFMMKNEVSNKEYRDFLNDLKLNGRTEEFHRYTIDSAGWNQLAGHFDPFATHYHAHPAYDNYPVCNISYEGALAYAEWLESQMNIHSEKTGKVYDVRLPNKAEWIRAANGANKRANYAWGGPDIRNAKGCALCNFNGSLNEEDKEQITLFMDDNAMITSPSGSYSPNVFGLYQMNGNIAEMVQERGIAMGGSWRSPASAVLNTSQSEYTTSSPSVGFRCVVEVR